MKEMMKTTQSHLQMGNGLHVLIAEAKEYQHSWMVQHNVMIVKGNSGT